jgi:hypothetical protein
MAKYFKHTGNFSRTTKFLNGLLRKDYLNVLNKYGHEGVMRLIEYTPKDTGLTAMSWNYVIEEDKDKGLITLTFINTNVKDDWCNIAIMLQYGHATKNGGWVEGIDYINPALQPVFDKMADAIWMEITETY